MKYSYIILLFTFFKGFAFKPKGHQAIELEAYNLLREYPATIDTPNGKTILEFLKSKSILKNDELPHSHFPDFSLDRQFEQNRQMYHFMANNSDVRKAANLSTADSQKEHLLLASLGNNLKLIYFLFRESVDNCPEGPRQSGRGIYVLMHIIADSYSPEHTIRDGGTGNIITIKGWKFGGFFWPSNAIKPDEGTLRLLHNGTGKAVGDDMWGEKNRLSSYGLEAAKAIRELLIATYRAKNNPNQSDELIVDYLKRFFTPFNNYDNLHGFKIANKSIPISFKDEYENEKTREKAVFDFDRSPEVFMEIQGQFNTQISKGLTSLGITYGRYIAPKNADVAPSLFNRIPFLRVPWGWSISLNKLTNSINKDFTDDLRFKAFIFFSASIPSIHGVLEPKIGIAISPLNMEKYFTINRGIDLVWNIGNDFYPRLLSIKKMKFVKPHARLRLSLGYEYETLHREMNLITLNPHHINLKIGFNTFHARMPHNTCR